MKKIKVLIVERNKEPFEATVDNNLKAMREIIGGHLERLSIGFKVNLICDEEGKLKNYECNRTLYQFGSADYIAGSFFLVSNDGEGNFVSLNQEQKDYYKKIFRL